MKAVTEEAVQRVVNRLQAGDPAAYAEIVQRFQEMAGQSVGMGDTRPTR